MTSESAGATRILVGIDGSKNAATALRWAVDVARRTHQSVEALCAWHVPSLAYCATSYMAPSQQAMSEGATEDLRRAVAASGADGFDVTSVIVQGQAVNALVHAAEDPTVSLVVVGATGHSGLVGVLLGSVARAMTHRCPKPLVVVPSGWDARATDAVTLPILVGVDLSAESMIALRWATEVARVREVPLEAVLVWGEPGAPVFIEALGLEVESRVPWFTKRMKDMVRDAGICGVPITYVVEAGVPSEVLVKRAAHAQMLVIGSRHLRWAHEMVAGSVSHACMSHSPTPIVLVPNVTGPAT